MPDGLADAILEKQGLSSSEAEPVISSTPESDDHVFEAAADEMWRAMRSDDKGAFTRTLRAMLDIEKAKGGG